MNAALLIVTVCGFCASAMAAAIPDSENSKLPVEQYTYSTHLDIAKFISMSTTPSECDVAPMRMTYEDSNGTTHVLEFRVFGNGCTNG